MIEILLSTYNGEKYIKYQIESILNQSCTNFSIIIRDDGSNDKTIEILEYYELMHKDKIKIVRDNLGNLGPGRSFMELLNHSKGEYIMFCDQDDIWLPNKIELTFKKMKELEMIYGKETPILVFTDLKVVEDSLNIISHSFWNYQKIDPNLSKKWKMLLAFNVVTGCTLMINRRAKDVVLPYKLPEMIHDHWVGVNISKHGVIDYIPIPTVLYRQHRDNVIGAHRNSIVDIKIAWYIKRAWYFSRYFSKYFEISPFELMFLKIKINLFRWLK